jgi:EEF1A lysine methyltransferase 4
MSVPRHNSEYANKDYWEKRYAADENLKETRDPFFEWLSSNHRIIVQALNDTVQSHFPNMDLNILIEGCGNSKLGENLVDLGYKHITNIDYSEAVIDTMQKYYRNLAIEKYIESMTWLVQDIRKMDSLCTASYDVVIDKATLDVFFCQPNVDLWHPDSTVAQPILETLTEVQRVLKPNGLFLYVSFGQPHFRCP